MSSPPSSSAPRTPLVMGGLGELLQSPVAPGLALMGAAAFAMVVANSPLAAAYHGLLQTPVSVAIGSAGLHKPMLLWINDGLMASFFLLVGLEVKRELLQGELSSVRKAALPVAAALGGMLVPALIYTALNMGGEGAVGWAIPMATDIAFALGVLALLGDRVPLSLRVFLAAFAVADDIGAVIVIALFYTASLKVSALVAAGALLALLVALNRLGVRNLGVYLLVGGFLWVAVLKSGVHATIAGVLLALTVPLAVPGDDDHSPLVHLEHTLHPWVTWLVLPVFALANAGVTVVGTDLDLAHPIAVGIGGGLVLGKLAGVTGASWLAVRLGLGSLPQGANWTHMLGIALLGGIGFTMSAFVAGLSFDDAALLDTAKLGIMGGSAIAAIAGLTVLRLAGRGAAASSSTAAAG